MATSEQLGRGGINSYQGEIDLFALIESLWNEKLLILSVIFLSTAMALFYALTAQPVYQAFTTLNQPLESAVQSYNLGRKEVGFSDYSASNIYEVFLKNLSSQSLRNDFFEEFYFPYLSDEKKSLPRTALIREWNEVLVVKPVVTERNGKTYQVTVEMYDPEKAAEWANLYVQNAISVSKKEIRDDIKAEIEVRKASVSLKIESLIAKAELERQDELVKLKEALKIASAIGLESPSMPEGKATQEGANYVDRNLTYMRGTKALSGQIAALEERKNSHAFVPNLRDYTAELSLLESLTVNDDRVEVVKIEQIALVPDRPIKPKKTLIMAVGVLLGGMLGVFVALIRIALRQRKEGNVVLNSKK